MPAIGEIETDLGICSLWADSFFYFPTRPPIQGLLILRHGFPGLHRH